MVHSVIIIPLSLIMIILVMIFVLDFFMEILRRGKYGKSFRPSYIDFDD